MPDGLANVLIQLPVVGIFVWFVISFLKWHQEQMKMLLEMFQAKIAQLSDRVELLTQQLAINTGTVNESLRTSELIEEIKALLVAATGNDN